jgi:Ca-activated chloride channel family protein
MTTPKPQSEWKLPELAAAAGVSPRTVRYYVQRGLLPAPPFRGPDTVYGEEHLLRLKAIRALQARFLPLDAIQVELARLDADALRGLAESGAEPRPPATPVPVKALEGEPEASAVCPPGSRAGSQPRVAGYQRWELAPGLELHLAETADAKVRGLAEKVRALIEQAHEGEKP